jgi:hypothetical protein
MIMEHCDNGDSEYTLGKVKVFVGAEDKYGSTVRIGTNSFFDLTISRTSKGDYLLMDSERVRGTFKTKWDAVDFILESLGK